MNIDLEPVPRVSRVARIAQFRPSRHESAGAQEWVIGSRRRCQIHCSPAGVVEVRLSPLHDRRPCEISTGRSTPRSKIQAPPVLPNATREPVTCWCSICWLSDAGAPIADTGNDIVPRQRAATSMDIFLLVTDNRNTRIWEVASPHRGRSCLWPNGMPREYASAAALRQHKLTGSNYCQQ